jgi:hypothetical protein
MRSFLLLALLSIVAIAQDGFHAEEKAGKCTRKTCLVANGIEIGLVEKFDRELEEKYLDINTDSALSDVIYVTADVCFKGDIVELKRVLAELADNENELYSQGGHSMIKDVIVKEKDKNLSIKYTKKDDYVGLHEVEKTISRCK